jgi:hypothetical protein
VIVLEIIPVELAPGGPYHRATTFRAVDVSLLDEGPTPSLRDVKRALAEIDAHETGGPSPAWPPFFARGHWSNSRSRAFRYLLEAAMAPRGVQGCNPAWDVVLDALFELDASQVCTIIRSSAPTGFEPPTHVAPPREPTSIPRISGMLIADRDLKPGN